jgi:CHAT domain-containing protein/tetratricopeptide (TPR) repeat protein
MALRPEDRLSFQAAENALAEGRYREAQVAFHGYLKGRLETIAPNGSYSAPDAVAIERLAELSSHLGGESSAEELMEALAGLFCRFSNRLCERLAVLRLAHLRLRRGALRLCLETLERLETWSGPIDELVITREGLQNWEAGLAWGRETLSDRRVVLALWYLLLGRISAANGQYQEAECTYQRGLEHTGVPEARVYEAGLRLGRAQALLESGELDLALQAVKAMPEPGWPEEIAGLEIVAKVQLMKGQLGQAKETYEYLTKRTDELDLPLAAGALRLSLAHLLILLNQTGRAQVLIEEASELARSVGAGELEKRAQALNALARLRRTSQAAASAIAPSVTELQMEPFEPNRRQHEELRIRLNFPPQESFLATFEDRLVEYQQTLAEDGVTCAESYLQLLQAFGSSDSLLVKARLTMARGLFHYRGEQVAEAQRLFADAEHVFAELGLLVELRQLKRYQTWCAAMMGDANDVNEQRLQEGTLLDKLANSLKTVDQGLFWLNKWTEDEEALSADLEVLMAHQRKSHSNSRWLRCFYRFRIWCELGRFLQKLDEHKEKRLRQALDISDVVQSMRGSWWSRLLRYPRGRAVVSFLVLPDRVFIGCIWRFGADFKVCPVSRIEARELVSQFHHHLVSDEGDKAAISILRSIAAAIEIEALLSGLPSHVRSLSFIPDDTLFGIPFAALPIGQDCTINRWTISHAFNWFPETKKRVVTLALMVAVTDPGGGFKRLEHAEDEIAAVEKICGSNIVTRLEQQNACRQTVLETLPQASMWHVACHGVFKPDAPGSSGIVLHGVDRQRLEILALTDLAQMDLHKMRLAFLASCWSADNFVSAGRWVVGLPHALHVAGTETVIGSLWEALDDVSAQFTRMFYEQLRLGAACDEAFRHAVLFCQQDANGQKRPLWDWAGFVLAGNVGRIEWRNQ